MSVPANSHGRQTVQVRDLLAGVPTARQPDPAPPHTHNRETVRLSHLQQSIQQVRWFADLNAISNKVMVIFRRS